MQAQIVVPVHAYDRPIRRAVESVLKAPDFGALVVAHGIDPQNLDLPASERLETIRIDTGVGYPGVAFNAGFKATTAQWVGIMGSDDWFEDGALTAMLHHGHKDKADGVIAPLRLAAMEDNTGIPKSWRRRGLRGRRDHLFWRTSPLGIFRRELMLSPGHEFDETVKAGVDQINSVLLWSSGAKFSYYPNDPAYVVGDDAVKRTSSVSTSLSVHAASWAAVWDDERIQALPLSDRRLLANRMLTVHVFSVVRGRGTDFSWDQLDRAWVANLMRTMVHVAPGFQDRLTYSKRRAFDACMQGDLRAAGKILRESSYVENRLPSSAATLCDPHFWLYRKPSDWVSNMRKLVEK